MDSGIVQHDVMIRLPSGLPPHNVSESSCQRSNCRVITADGGSHRVTTACNGCGAVGGALPDVCALALGRCAPSGIVRTYQVMHDLQCCN